MKKTGKIENLFVTSNQPGWQLGPEFQKFCRHRFVKETLTGHFQAGQEALQQIPSGINHVALTLQRIDRICTEIEAPKNVSLLT